MIPTRVGDALERDFVVHDAMIHEYSDAIGDYNPVHLDDAFALRTRFGRRIAHGGILFGLISRMLGMEFPGPGTVFLKQTISFSRPVFVSDTVRIRLEAVEFLPKDGARIAVRITCGPDEVSSGEATVKLPQWALNVAQ